MVEAPSLNSPGSAAIRPRVRFAPSPTGYLHVGGARTALFNWLFARHHGGTLVLRIEDTDLERSTSEMVEGILQGHALARARLGRGPLLSDPAHGSVSRSGGQAGGLRACLLLLLHEGRAGATPRRGRRGTSSYVRWDLPQDFTSKMPRCAWPAGAPAAVRFAVPESGSTGFDDAVFGRVEFANSELEDFVLLRSDGGPTYHLSVVTDDVEMRITHIIRGADHISNTPKQVLLYQRPGRGIAGVRACAADPRAGQDAPEQAARRHQRDGLS